MIERKVQGQKKKTIHPSSLCFHCSRCNSQDNHEATDHQRTRNKRNNCHTPSTRRELPAHHPILSLKISMKAQYQHHNGHADEGRAKWLAQAAEPSTFFNEADGVVVV